jgi:hypothetical protein
LMTVVMTPLLGAAGVGCVSGGTHEGLSLGGEEAMPRFPRTRSRVIASVAGGLSGSAMALMGIAGSRAVPVCAPGAPGARGVAFARMLPTPCRVPALTLGSALGVASPPRSAVCELASGGGEPAAPPIGAVWAAAAAPVGAPAGWIVSG